MKIPLTHTSKFLFLLLLFLPCTLFAQKDSIQWQHLSSKNGEIEAPNSGNQQTSAAVADFDNDGINDFCISERTKSPSIVWYRRNLKGWNKYVVEGDSLSLEAGTTAADVDGDGDMDIISGGDGGRTKEVFWWENPYPNFESNTPWKKYLIYKGGGKYHDKIAGDFDGDGRMDVALWSQSEHKLIFTPIPDNPKDAAAWKSSTIYQYYVDGQMQQRGKYPWFKGANEHEGLAKIDIDGDGIEDIVGGGHWFKHSGNGQFSANIIDASYTFTRSVAGQFINGGRPEVILVVGDGWAPLNLYEYKDKTWGAKTILEKVSNGHSNTAVDFNGDGNLDLWNAEMTLGDNTNAVNRILLGDGRGNFPKEIVVSRGVDIHESVMADLDSDGDLDILGKPYNGDAPRLDIWLQNGTGKIIPTLQTLNNKYGLEIYSFRDGLKKDVPATLKAMKQMGFNEVEISGYYGLTPAQFKSDLKKTGLKCTSMLFDYGRFKNDLPNIIKEAKSFGVQYIGFAWIPHGEKFTKDDAVNAAAFMNETAQKLKASGFHFFYHPHGYEFSSSEEGTLFDYLVQHTTNDVSFQLDVFWAMRGGADPLSLLQKYPNRFSSLHVKDLKRGAATSDFTGSAPEETSVVAGKGQASWREILKAAVKAGVKHYYIEDEAQNAMEQVPQSLQYLKSLH